MSKKRRENRETPRPGQALHALRTRKGWTLAEVSSRTGLPVSTLSKMENDKVSLTYDKLVRLCEGLDLDIAELFSAAAGQTAGINGRRSVIRAGEGLVIGTENYQHIYPASELLNKRFVPIIVEIKARSLEEFGELTRHRGEEYTYVLEGTVQLHSELYEPLQLNAGDSIYFDSAMGHAYVAVGPQRCRVLAICSERDYRLDAVSDPLVEPASLAGKSRLPVGGSERAVRASAATSRAKGRRRAGKS